MAANMTIIERDAFLAEGDNRLFGLQAAGGNLDVPPDVEPGSDADIDRKEDTPGSEAEEPSPDDQDGEPIPSGDGEQTDDNIDDLRRRPDGTEQVQPGISRP